MIPGWAWFKGWLARRALPEHLRRGRLGERAAKWHLCALGLKFLTANYRTKRGEIDLVFRDRDCLVFVEVKTRSSEEWNRPAAAVDRGKRTRITKASLDYLTLLGRPQVEVRFDIVEVLLEAGEVREVRHLPGAFAMPHPFRYG